MSEPYGMTPEKRLAITRRCEALAVGAVPIADLTRYVPEEMITLDAALFRAEREIERLKEALAPFARWAECDDATEPDWPDDEIVVTFDEEEGAITLGDIRRARDALRGKA